MEQRGIHTDRGNINRGIEARNRTYTIHISEIRREVSANPAERTAALGYAREDFTAHEIEIPAMPQGKTVISYTEPKEAETREENNREHSSKEQEAKENYRALEKEPKQAEHEQERERGRTEQPKERERAASKGENGREMPSKEQTRERERTTPEREKGRTEPQREQTQVARERTEQPKEQERTASRGASGRENPPKEQTRERERTVLEREKGRTEPPRESKEREPGRDNKMRMRGDRKAQKGIKLPLYVRAALEMQKCQKIDNPKMMEKALETMRQENIKSYADHDIRLKEYREVMDIGNVREAALTKEIEQIKETIIPLEIHEEYQPYREKIEKAGLFQRGKLEKQYGLEMKGLRGSEERLQRLGIDPKTVTAEKQKERVAELTQKLSSIQIEGNKIARKSINLEKSQEMMKQLYFDRGIDHAERARELSRLLERDWEIER